MKKTSTVQVPPLSVDLLRRRIAIGQRASHRPDGHPFQTLPKLDPIWFDILSASNAIEVGILAAPASYGVR